METTSPLARFVNITKKIARYSFDGELDRYRRSDGHYKLGPCISYSLGRPLTDEGYTLPEMLDDYGEMYKICVKAIEYTKNNSTSRALEANVSLIESIVHIYTEGGVNSYGDRLYAMPSETIPRAEIISDNLADKETESVISEDKIEDLVSKINSLLTSIRNSSIDDVIKDRITQTLLVILDAVTRINFIGPEKMADNLDKLLGQLTQNVIINSKENEEKQTESWVYWQKGIEIFEGAQKIVESSKTLHPILLASYTYIATKLGLPSSK